MSNPRNVQRFHSVPVIKYPEGLSVGYVSSGRNRHGEMRHVAINEHGVRLGTFDVFIHAQDRVLADARRRAPYVEPQPEPETPAQRSERLAGELVADVLAVTGEHRYARAYGVLAGLIRGSISDSGAVGFAREVVRQLDAAQTRGEL